MQNTRTKKIAIIAVLSAMAYVVMAVGRIPVVAFLKYDPKDVIIAVAGLLFGVEYGVLISIIVSFLEMFTVSDTGWIGLIMNIVSTCAFVVPAAVIYKKNHTLKGAIFGLVCGIVLVTCVMILWNYFLTPIYMKVPRQAIVEMLIPVFLPFNLIKYSLNAALTLLIYKPLSNALQRLKLVDPDPHKHKPKLSIIMLSIIVVATCVLAILVMQGRL